MMILFMLNKLRILVNLVQNGSLFGGTWRVNGR